MQAKPMNGAKIIAMTGCQKFIFKKNPQRPFA
jgi:hypothetical protein